METSECLDYFSDQKGLGRLQINVYNFLKSKTNKIKNIKTYVTLSKMLQSKLNQS